MNVNNLFSKPPSNLMAQTKFTSHQSNALSGMEHPLIIPLQGSVNAVIGNSPALGPIPILNQQLLVPLAALQTAGDDLLPLVRSIPDSSSTSKSIDPQQSVVQALPKSPALGLNFVANKANPSSVPLITDSPYNHILNHALHIQPSPPLNHNISVQYAINQSNTDEERVKDANNTQNMKTESQNKKTLNLKALTEGQVITQSCSLSTSDLSNNYCQIQETKTIKSSGSKGTSDVDSDSLSKVISSLPPGWKIVGLTHLTDGTHPTPVVETSDRITCRTNAASEDHASHLPSPPHHHCGVPEVVSVDLNVPTTLSLSADIFNDCLDKKTKMENIVLPVDLSDISSAKVQNVSKTCFLSPSNSSHGVITGSEQSLVKVKKEIDAVSDEAPRNTYDLDISKNEWKVIGLTTSSLPQTSTSERIPQVSNVQLPLPLLFSPDLGGPAEDRQAHSRSPKAATILNVPTPKLIQQQSVKPLSPQKLTSLSESSCDEVRWTIVGVTMANSTPVINGSNATSISMTGLKNTNSDNIKTDCTVTHCQQRPVSCSESKNAPLPSEINQKGIDSMLIKDQWKVVGITHSTNENQITPIPPLNYQIPVPLAQVQQTSPVASTSLSAATTNAKLNSNNSAVTTSTSSSTCLSANLNNVMPFITPSLLPHTGQSNTLIEQQQQLLLNIVQNQLNLQLQQQQQEQRELMMSQIQSQLLLQNQIPFRNSINEWNLVGLMSNIPQTLTATSNPAEINDFKKGTDTNVTTNDTSKNITSKEMSVSSTTKMCKNHEDSLSVPKKPRQSRSRDIAVKFTKKNTVSHLLKLKRMKMKAGEDDSLSHSDQEGYEVDKNMKQVKDQMALLSKSDKTFRSRPLHSYAGNRKIFSKSFTSQREEGKQKISLRSGNQVPANNIEFDYDKKNWSDEKEDLSAQVPGNIGGHNDSSPPADIRSSARKRKLKIPRKMIADIDYQPFDSSSDSS